MQEVYAGFLQVIGKQDQRFSDPRVVPVADDDDVSK
jgi:hypothetical protein